MKTESDLTRGMFKKSLIEYFKIKHTKGGCCKQIFNLSLIDENSSFEEVFEKVTGKSYNNYLKKLEKIKKTEAKIEYEKKIPQRKLNLKKSDIKVIQGVFPEELASAEVSTGVDSVIQLTVSDMCLNKQHIIIKCKLGKRIIILNIWVREMQDSKFFIRLPEYVILTKDLDGNIYVHYDKKPPYCFEIEYCLKANDISHSGTELVARQSQLLLTHMSKSRHCL